MRPIILVSGGFDPVHVGHVRMIEAAAVHGRVYIALNSDDWLLRKKGFVFMPWRERREVLLALRYVEEVIQVDDYDDTVTAALLDVCPDYFANGGDRTIPNEKERDACLELGIKELFGVGGEKIQSSSQLTERVRSDNRKNAVQG